MLVFLPVAENAKAVRTGVTEASGRLEAWAVSDGLAAGSGGVLL